MSSSDVQSFADEQPATVLLVDDDDVNRLLTSVALRDRGFRVEEAASGESALTLLETVQPDVLVLDALMPGMDGFQTCRALRAMPGFESLPVLMLTGLDDEESIARAYEAGASDFFIKSTQWTLLAGRLAYLLRSARTRQELERNRAKLVQAQQIAKLGSFEWRRNSRQIVGTIEGMRALGLGEQAALSVQDFTTWVHPDDREELLRLLQEGLQQRAPIVTDFRMQVPGQRDRVMHVEAEPYAEDGGQAAGYTGIIQDVTERRAAEQRIRQLANFDELTGLPNRRQVLWRCERAIEAARRDGHKVAVLFIDVDRFKTINDTLGHAAGDILLKEVGQRLRACVRHSDVVTEDTLGTWTRSPKTLEAVGRLGGDEFVALLPALQDEADAQRVAARMLDAFRTPVIVSGQECFVTASVGISLFPRDGNTVNDLIRNADVAMYSVKSTGRNAAHLFQPALVAKKREQLELESALHKAIERQELVLHFQPKINVREGTLFGVEALMRWQYQGRIISPAEFIPLAEETGLIIPMGEWAINEACRQIRDWGERFNILLSVGVNLPSRHFHRGNLVDVIQGVLQRYALPARAVELEITETALMQDLEKVIPVLKRLHASGVEIAIDDFGTGYSSLAYLTTLPISTLKIDRSFTRDLGRTRESTAVVTAILALARSLSLNVVAEGVETMAQVDVLSRLGCRLMQGFLFSKPLPAHELEQWMTRSLKSDAPPGWTREVDELGREPGSGPASEVTLEPPPTNFAGLAMENVRQILRP